MIDQQITIVNQGMEISMEYYPLDENMPCEDYLHEINRFPQYFVSCKKINGSSVSFDISYMMTLEKYLKTKLNKENVCKIFASITKAYSVFETNDSLKDNLLLDARYIFVDFMTHNLKMTIIPYEKLDVIKTGTISSFLKNLLINLEIDYEREYKYLVDIFRILVKHGFVNMKVISEELSALAGEMEGSALHDAIRDQPRVKKIEIPKMADNTEDNTVPLQIYNKEITEPAAAPLEHTSSKDDYRNEEEVQDKKIEYYETDGTILVEPYRDQETVVQTAPDFENYRMDHSSRQPSEPNPHLIRFSNGEIIYLKNGYISIGSAVKKSKGSVYNIYGNSTISKLHAVIERVDGVFYLTNFSDNKHTLFNGAAMEHKDTKLLINDTKFTLGNENFVYELF